MKKYVTILIGVVVLLVLLYGGQSLVNNRPQADIVDLAGTVATKSVKGEVKRVYNGDNVLEYSFDIPDTATTTTDMDGALIRVTNEENPLVTIYISYEGARGYNAIDYLNNIVAPHVSVITPTNMSTIGEYEWQGAESEGSEWKIASVQNGKWLIIVESKKTVHDSAEKIISSTRVN